MKIPRRSALFLARHRRATWNRAVAKGCRAYLNAFDNLDYDGATNGEFALVERMSFPRGAVALDVGANVGAWSAHVQARHPSAVVHAFEIDPEVAAPLAERFAADANVTVVAAGLSDHAGPAMLRRHSRSSRVTSVVESSTMNADATTFEVELLTGDGHLATADLGRVRLAKVDTEGNDLNVLRGFRESLGAGRIDALQFEHNEWSIPAGVHLKDFYDLLTPHGYEIGRLFPDCVLFRPWRPAYEREAAGNHVAVHRDHPDVRAQAAGAAASG